MATHYRDAIEEAFSEPGMLARLERAGRIVEVGWLHKFPVKQAYAVIKKRDGTTVLHRVKHDGTSFVREQSKDESYRTEAEAKSELRKRQRGEPRGLTDPGR